MRPEYRWTVYGEDCSVPNTKKIRGNKKSEAVIFDGSENGTSIIIGLGKIQSYQWSRGSRQTAFSSGELITLILPSPRAYFDNPTKAW